MERSSAIHLQNRWESENIIQMLSLSDMDYVLSKVSINPPQ